MTIDVFPSRLRNVKQTGRGKWIASSPTREDKHLLLSIRERLDGCILILDFGGSSAQEILDAVGLIFSDLFLPERNLLWQARASLIPGGRHGISYIKIGPNVRYRRSDLEA